MAGTSHLPASGIYQRPDVGNERCVVPGSALYVFDNRGSLNMGYYVVVVSTEFVPKACRDFSTALAQLRAAVVGQP